MDTTVVQLIYYVWNNNSRSLTQADYDSNCSGPDLDVQQLALQKQEKAISIDRSYSGKHCKHALHSVLIFYELDQKQQSEP